MAMKPIEILINAKDNASSVFDGLKTKLTAVGAAVAAYFGVNAFIGAVKGAADFEQGMSRVKAATGASADEMAKLRQAAEDAGANTKYTSTEAAAALETLAKAGLSASDSIAALPAVLNLAQAGDIELATASEYVTKAVMGMGLAFSDAGRVADVLALGANATNTSVTGLAQALSYAAPVANTLGLSLESTVAIIGKFADAGIDASRAGTALNSIMSQFADPASKFRQELGAAGITTNNFEEALHQLAAAGPRGAKAINAVGMEAGPALRALLNQGMPALDELTAKLKSAEGSAAATAKVMQDNLSGSMTGLGSAWDTVKNVLGTPVLPVLKDGVDQLTGALRGAVSDGTIAKFGESIATAFQAGIKWVREFVAQVDFGQVAADMRAYADRAGEVFAQIGEYATNAGNIVKLGYGVMSAGANTVLGMVYLVGEAFAALAGNIQSSVARIMDGFAKVTFGSVSAGFKAAADEIRLSAEATRAASEALGAKSSAAFQRVADGAQLARDGFTGLANAANDAAPAVTATGRAIGDMAKQLEAVADKNAAVRKATEEKAASDVAATAAVRQLKDEYGALVSSGNLQAAAEKLQEINKTMQAAPAASKDAVKAAQEAAQLIADAFQRLGVTSSADLKLQADAAQRDYNIIKNAGTSTAEDISKSFQKAAQAAITANNGVAPSWVTAQAAVRGFGLEADAAGKVVLKATAEGAKGFADLGQNVRATTEDMKAQVQALDTLNAKYGQSEKDKAGKYGRPGAGDTPEDERARRLGGQNAVDNTLMFKLRDKGANLTAADIPELEAVLAAERKNDKMINNRPGGRAGLYSLDGLRDDSNWRQIKAGWQSFIDGEKNKSPAGADPRKAQDSQPGPGATYVSNITLDGQRRSMRYADRESQQAGDALIRQLARDKGVSQ